MYRFNSYIISCILMTFTESKCDCTSFFCDILYRAHVKIYMKIIFHLFKGSRRLPGGIRSDATFYNQ